MRAQHQPNPPDKLEYHSQSPSSHICTVEPRPQRRLNGLQLPLNYQQVIAWIVLVTTALLNFLILTEVQFYELKIASLVFYVILYFCHIGSHATALLTDPGERELRKLKVNDVPEFDRSIHAHVIENGRCHLCNIYTSSRRTKHCSLCNKCVHRFDHHCKWLNNCVGHRNYAAFITSVITALLISVFTSSLCVTDIVLFLTHPERLSPAAQNFINCTSLMDTPQFIKYCRNSISFLTFMVIFSVVALAIGCALLHLYCFHVYIAFLGVSTYEYIMRSDRSKISAPSRTNLGCCANTNKFSKRLYWVRKDETKTNTTGNNGAEESSITTRTSQEKATTHSNVNNEGEANKLISFLFATEFDRAKRIFSYNDKNRIHPHNETAS